MTTLNKLREMHEAQITGHRPYRTLGIGKRPIRDTGIDDKSHLNDPPSDHPISKALDAAMKKLEPEFKKIKK